ncbi:MAG: fatty acid desaturase [Bacteroidetes bacterium]|nr:fatty acid desaturase [Bacteroidota bacterium]
MKNKSVENHTAVWKFRADNYPAFLGLLLPAVLAGSGIYLSFAQIWGLHWWLAQVLLAVFFFQCFILLHECGHLTYFRTRWLNPLFGHLFAFISLIPFASWVAIHNLHHKWTGYRDKDPTTEGTVNPQFGIVLRFVVNVSWLFWIPLFTVGYRLGNYWNLKKMKNHIPARQMPVIYRNMVFQTIVTVLIFIFWGHWIWGHLGMGYLLSLMLSDLFILSQHSHIEIPLAGSREVQPLRFADQVKYTRSVKLNTLMGRWLYFNFHLHEKHHAWPGIPAYHLHRVQEPMPNTVPFFHYLKDAKSLSGMEFVFRTSSMQIGKVQSQEHSSE